MQNTYKKPLALLFGLALVAAACGSDDDTTAEPADDTPTTVAEDDAMEDDAMEDDAMEDDAMEDDAMEDDAMEDDAMEDDAMEDDAMSDGRPILNIEFDGLEPLGDDLDYEVWTIVDGEPVSGGLFDFDATGELVITSDQGHLYGHEGATDVVISIEPSPDDDPAPAEAKPLGGVIDADGNFVLSADHPAVSGAIDGAEGSGAQV